MYSAIHSRNYLISQKHLPTPAVYYLLLIISVYSIFLLVISRCIYTYRKLFIS